MGTRLRSSTRASTAASTAASESLAETLQDTKVKGDSRKTTSIKPLRGSELARLAKIAVFTHFASLALLAGTYYAVTNDLVRLYPHNLPKDALVGFGSRVEFALRYQTLLFAWLVFSLVAVIYNRLTKRALNPLVESTEKHVLAIKAILSNSIEQIFISSMLQLAYVSFGGQYYTLRLIPAINIAQLIGRITFAIGYPYYRTFGFTLTLAPNIYLVCFNLYKLGYFLNFY